MRPGEPGPRALPPALHGRGVDTPAALPAEARPGDEGPPEAARVQTPTCPATGKAWGMPVATATPGEHRGPTASPAGHVPRTVSPTWTHSQVWARGGGRGVGGEHRCLLGEDPWPPALGLRSTWRPACVPSLPTAGQSQGCTPSRHRTDPLSRLGDEAHLPPSSPLPLTDRVRPQKGGPGRAREGQGQGRQSCGSEPQGPRFSSQPCPAAVGTDPQPKPEPGGKVCPRSRSGRGCGRGWQGPSLQAAELEEQTPVAAAGGLRGAGSVFQKHRWAGRGWAGARPAECGPRF